MARKLSIPLSAAIAGALIAASPASAVTCDELQPALDAAAAGSTVTVDQGLRCPGGFTLPSRPITLEGAGAGATLDGEHDERILFGSDVGETVIRNLRFEAGDAGFDGGGAIYVGGNSPITIEDSTFTGNDATGPGGAVAIDPFGFQDRALARTAEGAPARVTILRSTFGGEDGNENTSGSSGGAVSSYLVPIDVIDSEFSGNVAESGGGGLSAFSSGTLTLTGNTFSGNVGRGAGGGAEVGFCDQATVSGNTFEDNTVGLRRFQESRQAAGVVGGRLEGGGLWITGGCFIEGSRAALGSKDGSGTLAQSGNAFRANELAAGVEGQGEGAGEFVRDVGLTSTDDTFHANEVGGESTGRGAGLRILGGDGALLRNFVATANTMPTGEGGGVAFGAQGESLRIVHGTIAANAIGEGQGSGIFGGDGQSLLVENSIVHGNTGGTEIAGFDPFDRTALGVQASTVELAFTLACDGSAAFAGEGNLCADPKLANAPAGDVHQTAASPTLEEASSARTDGLEQDYEGDARSQDYDRSGTAEPDMGADEAPAPAVQQPQPQPQPAAPAPAPSGGVLGTRARRCSSRRTFRIKLRNRRQKVVKATVIVNGKRVKVLRGRRLTSRVNLRGLPKGRFTVRIKLRLANGKVISGTRRYRTCTRGVRSGPPRV